MLRLGTQKWEIFRLGECKVCRPIAALRDRFAARFWLQQFKGNALWMGAIRHMLSRESSISWALDKATDDEVIEQAAQLLAAGVWHVHEPAKAYRADTQSPRDAGEAADQKSKQSADARRAGAGDSRAQRPTADKSKELTWIEIQLIDADGKPVTGMPYEIKLPDGSIQSGKLDVVGRGRHEQIPPGQCEVRFPELDGGDWKPA
jgi:hypothetical protein